MKLPKTLYVRVVRDGKDEYFNTAESPADGIEEGERHDVGVYELKQITTVEWRKEVTVTPTKLRG